MGDRPIMTDYPSPRCALFVSSCDPYSDLWAPFFRLFRRHWPDCPFPVYLGAGEKESGIPGVVTLKSTGGRDWSLCLQQHLGQISEPWIIFMLDDFFLRRRVATVDILQALDFADRQNARMLRLVPRPPPARILPNAPDYGECDPDQDYRVNVQAGLWRKQALESLLVAGDSIWEFEHRGTERARAFPRGFYCTRRSVLPYEGWLAHHVIEKGRWFPHEKWIFRDPALGCDFQARGTLGWGSTLIYQFAHLIHRGLQFVPWRQRQAAITAVKSRLPRPVRQRLAVKGVMDARERPPSSSGSDA
jgi:hypothetical protein